MDYMNIVTLSQISQPSEQNLKNSEILRVGVEGYTPLATCDKEAWAWATNTAHEDSKALYAADAFRFFYLWNSCLEGM